MVSNPRRRQGFSAVVLSAVVCRLAVLLIVSGLLGQLFLQSFSRSDETPRAAIERLIGVDISSVAGSHEDMSMMDMPISGQMEKAMPSSSVDGRHHMPGHDESCPLCPLLELVAIILTGLTFLPSCTIQPYRLARQPYAPRAPPEVFIGLPPSRGPPRLN